MATIPLQWLEKDGQHLAVSKFDGAARSFTIKPPKKRRTWYALEHASLPTAQRYPTLDEAKKSAQFIADQGVNSASVSSA